MGNFYSNIFKNIYDWSSYILNIKNGKINKSSSYILHSYKSFIAISGNIFVCNKYSSKNKEVDTKGSYINIKKSSLTVLKRENKKSKGYLTEEDFTIYTNEEIFSELYEKEDSIIDENGFFNI